MDKNKKTKRFLQMISFLDKRNEEKPIERKFYWLKPRLKEFLEGNKAKKKTVLSRQNGKGSKSPGGLRVL